MKKLFFTLLMAIFGANFANAYSNCLNQFSDDYFNCTVNETNQRMERESRERQMQENIQNNYYRGIY